MSQYYRKTAADLLADDRILMVKGEITEALCNHLMEQLLVLSSPSNPKRNLPIKLYINNGGGSVYAGLEVIETMKKVQETCPIYGIAMGIVASMATQIFIHCNVRIATSSATIMIHEGASGTQGKYSAMKSYMKNFEVLEELLIQQLFDNTKMWKNRDEYDLEIGRKHDIWIMAEEALARGVCDFIEPDRPIEREVHIKYYKEELKRQAEAAEAKKLKAAEQQEDEDEE